MSKYFQPNEMYLTGIFYGNDLNIIYLQLYNILINSKTIFIYHKTGCSRNKNQHLHYFAYNNCNIYQLKEKICKIKQNKKNSGDCNDTCRLILNDNMALIKFLEKNIQNMTSIIITPSPINNTLDNKIVNEHTNNNLQTTIMICHNQLKLFCTILQIYIKKTVCYIYNYYKSIIRANIFI
uniref:Uncharacterized protein n=1 Tax=Faxonius propinquus nudivirus TaxID=3139431 RepID=A0AAU8GE95_9VIRU